MFLILKFSERISAQIGRHALHINASICTDYAFYMKAQENTK